MRGLTLPAATVIVLAALAGPLSAQDLTVEIRSYDVRPGARDEFHRLVVQTLPLLRRWNVDVVAYGPSAHDTTSYYLVRAFPSVAARQRQEDAFYGSAEWRDGPRERVMALIQNYTTVVLSLDSAAVAALRATRSPDATGSCTVPGADEARRAVEQLNREYIDASRTADHAWFSRHLADDFVVILGGGRRLTRPEFVAMVRDGPRTTRSLGLRDVTVRVFGTTVQVDADAPWERLDGSRGVSRYIDTYAWLDCRWRVISAQITLLPQP
ncbi:MAG: nuclear transport factor 2 family protein [Gemmatimonadales bacterium]